jgi:hypothetical protein
LHLSEAALADPRELGERDQRKRCLEVHIAVNE